MMVEPQSRPPRRPRRGARLCGKRGRKPHRTGSCPLFWAGIGLFFFRVSGAACLAVLHRSANVLDALWGKKNKKYIRFGTFAARLDDAELAAQPGCLPFIAFASHHSEPAAWRHPARGLEIPRPQKAQFRMERGGLCRGPRPQARKAPPYGICPDHRGSAAEPPTPNPRIVLVRLIMAFRVVFTV